MIIIFKIKISVAFFLFLVDNRSCSPPRRMLVMRGERLVTLEAM